MTSIAEIGMIDLVLNMQSRYPGRPEASHTTCSAAASVRSKNVPIAVHFRKYFNWPSSSSILPMQILLLQAAHSAHRMTGCVFCGHAHGTDDIEACVTRSAAAERHRCIPNTEPIRRRTCVRLYTASGTPKN